MQNLVYQSKTRFCVDKPGFSLVIIGFKLQNQFNGEKPGFSSKPRISTAKHAFAEKNLVYQIAKPGFSPQNQVFLTSMHLACHTGMILSAMIRQYLPEMNTENEAHGVILACFTSIRQELSSIKKVSELSLKISSVFCRSAS